RLLDLHGRIYRKIRSDIVRGRIHALYLIPYFVRGLKRWRYTFDEQFVILKMQVFHTDLLLLDHLQYRLVLRLQFFKRSHAFLQKLVKRIYASSIGNSGDKTQNSVTGRTYRKSDHRRLLDSIFEM